MTMPIETPLSINFGKKYYVYEMFGRYNHISIRAKAKEVDRMFVNSISQNHQLFHVGAANRSIAKQTEAVTGKKSEHNQDRVTISPQGKKQSMIEQLMKQKQELIDRKNELMAKSAKTGQRMDSQIQQYEKQIEELNQQISDLQTDKQDDKKANERKNDLQPKEPKTEEEVRKEKMNALSQIANSGNGMDIIASVKDKVDGKINVLYAEIETEHGNIEAKMEKVSALEQKSNDLASQLSQKTGEVVEALAENNQTENHIVMTKAEIEEQKQEEQKQTGVESLQDTTDKVKKERLSM